MNTKQQIKLLKLSKGLSYILRHGAVKHNLSMSADGYILWNDINSLSSFKEYTLDDVLNVVKTNDKQRFSMKEENGNWYIRANQGHSHLVSQNINQNELLKKLNNPLDMIVHGTTLEAYDKIKETGLSRMGRSHIHFAISDDFVEGNMQQSGIRSNCKVLIYLDMQKAMDDGIEFYISENKVVLSQGIDGFIDKKYFKKIKKI